MSTSPITSPYKLPLRYVLSRNRQQAYNLLVREFKKSGLSQAEFARRAKKGTDLISRYLSRPRNLQLDTLGELLFALGGGAISFSLSYPNQKVVSQTQLATSMATKLLATAQREPLERTIRQEGTIEVGDSSLSRAA
jgi:hypothetical protein